MARNQQITISRKFSAPATRWILLGMFVTLCALILHAMLHQFIPTPAWYALGFKLNIAITIATTGWFYYILILSSASFIKISQRLSMWFAMLCMPIIFYFLGYVAIIYSIGSLAGSLSSTPHIIHDVLQKQLIESKKGCKTRLVGKSLKHALPPDFCISQASFNQLPQKVIVRLVGKQSHFGFDLHHIEYDWENTLKQFPRTLTLTALPLT